MVEVGGMVTVAVNVGDTEGIPMRESSAVTRRMRVASVGVLLGVCVAVGVFVAVGVRVTVAVSVGVIVAVLVAVSVGRTAIVGSSATDSPLPILKARRAITLPTDTKARNPSIHFFTRRTPVSALAYLLHGTETGDGTL
jgi:hypothetical protein